MADFLGLMKQAAELKSKMEAMQAELDRIEVEGAAGVSLTADFSSNLMRDLGVDTGTRLDVALPPDRLRVYAA